MFQLDQLAVLLPVRLPYLLYDVILILMVELFGVPIAAQALGT